MPISIYWPRLKSCQAVCNECTRGEICSGQSRDAGCFDMWSWWGSCVTKILGLSRDHRFVLFLFTTTGFHIAQSGIFWTPNIRVIRGLYCTKFQIDISKHVEKVGKTWTDRQTDRRTLPRYDTSLFPNRHIKSSDPHPCLIPHCPGLYKGILGHTSPHYSSWDSQAFSSFMTKESHMPHMECCSTEGCIKLRHPKKPKHFHFMSLSWVRLTWL